MPYKEFLEDYPLYKEYHITEFSSWSGLVGLPKPAINIYCNTCGSSQTFNMANDYWELTHRDAHVRDEIVRACYVCSSCHRERIFFFIKFYDKEFEKEEKGEKKKVLQLYMKKVGQYPSWSIETDNVLEKLLGEYADYYKKGLVCESQSYGVGAYAYFRRVTEDIIENLLVSITDLIEPSEKEKYEKALENARQTKRTEDKIDLVKDLLPLSLRPDGMNPLKTLHSALSVGLHNRTDEECMEQAEIIKNVLVFLVNQILKTKEDKKKFTDSMKKLLEKNNEIYGRSA